MRPATTGCPSRPCAGTSLPSDSTTCSHYDIPEVDPETWTLEVTGRVERPLRLTLADLRASSSRTIIVTMECAGNGRALLSPRALGQPWLVEAVGTAEWTGVPLRDVMEEAGLLAASRSSSPGSTGALRRASSSTTPAASRWPRPSAPTCSSPTKVAGVVLPPQHGFPLRLVVPGWYGMGNVKWLARIEAVSERYSGFQNTIGYRLRSTPEEGGIPVTRMEPRALMIPRGSPTFSPGAGSCPSGPACSSAGPGRAWGRSRWSR